MKYKMSELGKSLFGFTLTEVLIATGIVGIIAALVLPALVTHFRDEVLTHQLRRQMTAIKTAIDNLVITENKANFGETMMYSLSDSPDYDATSGAFIKKYLRVSKYYGDFATNKSTILKECFADKYYEFSGNDKKDFSISDIAKGACAKLKNGTSICLTPQVGQNALSGIIDLNGPKGPNVYGKDLMIIDGSEIAPVTFTAFDSSGESSESVATTDNPEITPDPDNPCEIGDYSEDCCKYYMNKGSITNIDHGCCNTDYAKFIPACAKEIVINVNYFPTNAAFTWGYWASGKTSPVASTDYANIRGSGTTAIQNNGSNTTTLTILPATPPDIYLYCDGVAGGKMAGTTLANAITDSKYESKYYFSRLSVSSVTKDLLWNKPCHHKSATEGIVSGQASVAFGDGSKKTTYNGITWTIKRH